MESMSEIIIKPLHALGLTKEISSQLDEIFFESSMKKEFRDEAERKEFQWKYLGFYLAHYPEYVWVAYSKKVLGYVLGMPVTKNPDLYKIQPHLKPFEDLFEKYPAHLHINCHFEARGLGVGSKLILAFEAQMRSLNLAGVHILTAPNSLNRSFYLKNGFTFESERLFGQNPILFMGRNL